MYKNLRAFRESLNMTQKEFAASLNLGLSTYNGYEIGAREPKSDFWIAVAKKYNVTIDYLMGYSNDPRMISDERTPAPLVTEDVVTFPVIGEVAAGYEHLTYESWAGDAIEIPRSYLHGRELSDFFVLKVIGDSMYPDYQDGDHVLVLRQPTMDRSGQIGVVIYGDEKGTLKRIEYVPGEDWMTLRPINPQYPPVTIRDEALEHCTVLGVAKMVIRGLE